MNRLFNILTIVFLVISVVFAFLYFKMKRENVLNLKQMEIINRNIIAQTNHIKEHGTTDYYKTAERIQSKALPIFLLTDTNIRLTDSLIHNFEAIKNGFLKLTGVKKYNQEVLIPLENNNSTLTNKYFLEEKKAGLIKKLIIEYVDKLKKIDHSQKFGISLGDWLKEGSWVKKSKLSVYTNKTLIDSFNNWEEKTFRDVSPITAYSILLTIENDIYQLRFMLNDAIYHYYYGGWSSHGGIYFRPLVMQKNYIVKQGEEYNSSIVIGEYNVRDNFYAYIEGKEIMVQGGIARYSVTAKKLGLHKVNGVVKVPRLYKNYVDTIIRPFTIDYYVIP